MLMVTGLLGIAGVCATALGAPNTKSTIAVAAAVPSMRRRTPPFLCDTFIGDSPLAEAALRRTRAAQCGGVRFRLVINFGNGHSRALMLRARVTAVNVACFVAGAGFAVADCPASSMPRWNSRATRAMW